MKIVHQRTSSSLPDLTPCTGGLAADLAFDIIEDADAFDGCSRDGRAIGYVNIVKLASDMCPARGFDDPAAFVEMMETSIAIGLQDACEVR
jgi:hypothetical protein